MGTTAAGTTPVWAFNASLPRHLNIQPVLHPLSLPLLRWLPICCRIEMPLVEPLDVARVVNKPIVLKPASTDGLLMSNDNSHLLLTKCHLAIILGPLIFLETMTQHQTLLPRQHVHTAGIMRDHDITDGSVVPISRIFSRFRITGTNDFPSNYVAHTDMVQDAVTQQLSTPRINEYGQSQP
nr:hypothetical protein [Tanacetum cinerariifolium]